MSKVKNKLSISIIIPCFNAEQYVKSCLDSVLTNITASDEVIVIDDGSRDKTNNILKSYRSKKLHIMKHTENIGPSRARNEGAKAAVGDILFFLDVDTKIADKTLPVIREFFTKYKEVGGIQCELRLSDSSLDSIGHFMTVSGFPYEVGVKENPLKYQTVRTIFGAKSAGMAVRHNVFQEINGFDESYLIYGEDTDLSWRIELAGYDLKYLPGSIVYHHQKSSMTEGTTMRVYYEGAKNNLNYILKNASSPTALYMVPLHIALWKLIALRLLFQGKYQAAFSIFKGLFWNVLHFSDTLQKRNKIIRKNTVQIYGDMNIQQLIQKGWRWFAHV